MIGLVVVNYNDYKNTVSFINSINDYKLIKHIVIVDNCSTDNSYSMLRKICNNKISLIKNESNKGYGSGINLGSKFLVDKGVKTIIVSNTDIIVNSESDLKKLCGYIRNNVVLVGPNVLENGGVNRGWKIPSVWDDCLLNIPLIHRILRKKLLFYKDDLYLKSTTSVEVVSGCFFIISADALEEVGCFDEKIFLYYEENVIAYKFKEKGYKALIVNDVNVIHNHSVTIDNSMNRIKKYKALKKSQKYFHKNYTKSGAFGMSLLYITDKIMLFLLYIVVGMHKIIGK